jgi:hypothetical protein
MTATLDDVTKRSQSRLLKRRPRASCPLRLGLAGKRLSSVRGARGTVRATLESTLYACA